MAKRTELAWAAGFFDGEGHSGVDRFKHKPYKYFRLSVAQKDIRPLQRFIEAVGYGKISGPYTGGIYTVAFSGKKAKAVYTLLCPYLSAPKREQAEGALEEALS